MDVALVAQLCMALAVLVVGVMLAVVGAFALAMVCGLGGGLWLARTARRL